MRRMRVAATAIALFGFNGLAHCDPISVFGLEMLRPLSVPECAFKRIGKDLVIYDRPAHAACFEKFPPATAGKPFQAREMVRIFWPFQSRPALAVADSVMVAMIDGNIESIGFNTLGALSAQGDLTELTKKFGQPTSLATPTVQNRFGATVQAITAEWKIDQISVYFNSVEYGLDTGLIRVESQKFVAQRQQHLEKEKGERTQL